ncbi:MAG: ATP-binding protein, partial [Terriglobales bacterium]
ISHEVRTPISAVIGMSELLLDTKLTEEQNEYTRLVRESALSLLTIINDILDFSKMEAGKIDLESIEFGVVPLVEGCAELLATSSRERGLSLMTFVDPRIPRALHGDPVRLRQVILNLMSNAIKFTETGEVLVRVSLLTEEKETVVLRIEVSDTGIGLSENARKLLFQPFVQADGSTSRRYGGTGLGLSISRRLVELMGGQINVESALGKGSTFWFTVPFQAQRTALEERAHEAAHRKSIRALILEESAASAVIVSSYLTVAGVESDVASDANEALAMLKSAAEAKIPYAVAFVGQANCDPAKIELSKRVAADQALQRTRMILLSTFDDRERVDIALNNGFAAVLAKPIRHTHLMEAVTKILSLPREPVSMPVEQPKAAPAAQIEEEPFALDCPVLVAEDNPVMQQLALRQIRKLGVNAVAASNGLEVLESVRKQKFALILMDCQMPEMDGFEATLSIRKDEAVNGGHTPIIAMTAAAMIGDREHCLTSGMDDYLSKPVSQEQLFHVLRKWLPKQAVSAVELANSAPNMVQEASGGPIDLGRLRELYGQEDLLGLLHSFVNESAEIAQSLVQHFDSRDARGLSIQAHQLKGLASVMCAEQLANRCLELERASKEHDWQHATAQLATVKTELDAVLQYIAALTDGKSPQS